ncbi:MAG: type III-B CRISPR module RAMP protein Cmr6 [Gloeocapsa sp. DLM2.Bin57]|nr:MAG: type III-B CRISPR module RAMP protein Cmr6 [Gloeocapsa sp. DLM2.Bin57]
MRDRPIPRNSNNQPRTTNSSLPMTTPSSPNPWLNEPINPDNTASFVEYLRWMRPYSDDKYREGTKLEIMQKAVKNADYRQRLELLSDRTKKIAGEGNYFQVKCPWRIRVGGHRGPESILLPAFDALGMPYIPSATLKGIARNQAIRAKIKTQNLSWEAAEKAIAPYFGSLDTANPANQAGKVVFLDAYPIPTQTGGLNLDMANNIWQWEGNQLKYSPNPNTFYSLQKSTFLIGIRLASTCKDLNILKQVKQWLIEGLKDGIGAQVNSGYGQLITAGEKNNTASILKLEFELEGQLIHGYQEFERWQWHDPSSSYRLRTKPCAEVRTTAFKSMLRYWFRVISLGVLTPNKVKEWEAILFGAIDPQSYGWVKFNLTEGRVFPETKDRVGKQTGTLILTHANNAPENQHNLITTLFKNLTWLMLNLGGVGQGARRPYYTRSGNPRHRGCIFYLEDNYWYLADTPRRSADLFKGKFQDFYSSLQQLTGQTCDIQQLNSFNTPTANQWYEVIDSHCRILLCTGSSPNHKPFALSVLHSNPLKVGGNYDPKLCGTVRGQVKPSPVWIVDQEKFQIVTIFGATENPRKQYLRMLKDQSKNIYRII